MISDPPGPVDIGNGKVTHQSGSFECDIVLVVATVASMLPIIIYLVVSVLDFMGILCDCSKSTTADVVNVLLL